MWVLCMHKYVCEEGELMISNAAGWNALKGLMGVRGCLQHGSQVQIRGGRVRLEEAWRMCVGEGEQEWRREIKRRKHGGRGGGEEICGKHVVNSGSLSEIWSGNVQLFYTDRED